MRLYGFLLLMCFSGISGLAKDKHLPLSPQVISAKTVYIDNRSGTAGLADRAYQELQDWGRFQVVQDRAQADLIFLLSSHDEVTGSREFSRQDQNGNVHTRSRNNVESYYGLTVLDPKTGDPLWTESKVGSLFRKSAIKRAIDELRKRIEEQADIQR